MANTKHIAGFDTETDGILMSGEVASVQFYIPNLEDRKEIETHFPHSGMIDGRIFIPLKMEGVSEEKRDSGMCVARYIVDNFSLIGHNLYFDLLQLKKIFPQVTPKVGGDSQTLAQMAQIRKIRLKDLVVELGIVGEDDVVKFGDLVPGHDSTKVPFDDETFIKYALNDAEWAYRAETLLREKYMSLMPTYLEELNYLLPFVEMSWDGMEFDYAGFSKFRENYINETEEFHHKMIKEVAFSFRPNSGKDIAHVLHDIRKLPMPTIKTKKGAHSYSEESLKQYEGDKFVDKLMVLKHRSSVVSTIKTIEKYLPDPVPEYPKLHPFYKIVGADATSRVYTTNPSANSLPREWRRFILPKKDHRLVYYDWSGAELMTAAYWANEEWLIEAYESDVDVHKMMAAKLLDKKITQISDDDREVSKVVTFSVLYGSEGGAAARKLKIEYNEAANLVAMFWEICPNIAELRRKIVERTMKSGFTYTITGRRRRLPAIFSPNDKDKQGAVRQAFNTAIQGSVADLQKKHIQDCSKLFWSNLKVKFCTTVFDSFLLQVPNEVKICDVETIALGGSSFDVNGISVNLKADFSQGNSYAEAAGQLN